MQDNSVVGSIDELPAEMVRARIRIGRRALPRPLGRLALLLAAAVGLPWLPILVEPPANRPMQRLPGVTGSALYRMAFDPVNHILATIDERGDVALQPIEEGTTSGRRLDVPGFARAIAFSPDGRTLAISQIHADILLFYMDPGITSPTMGPPVRQVTHLAFAPDGRILAFVAGQGRDILLWNIEARRPLTTLHLGELARSTTALAFAPVGHTLATADYYGNAVLIWDIPTGRILRRLRQTGLAYLAYSPDGRALAVVGHGVQIYDPSTGALIRTMGNGREDIRRAAFSPDGLRLAIASVDGIASVWDVETGRERMRLDSRTQVIRDVAFSDRGRTLLAIGSDGDIRRWDLDGPDIP